MKFFRRSGAVETLEHGKQFSPDQKVTVDFEPTFHSTSVLISTHVDTLQALMLEGMRHQSLGLFVLGRELDGQLDRILDDPLFRLFTGLRSFERARAIDRLNELLPADSRAVRRPKYTVDMAIDEPFKCRYIGLNQIVREFENGDTTPILLMPLLGGVTTIEFASHTASKPELDAFADDLKTAVWDRQLGSSIVSDVILAATQGRIISGDHTSYKQLNNYKY
jgi:hypothetical protein